MEDGIIAWLAFIAKLKQNRIFNISEAKPLECCSGAATLPLKNGPVGQWRGPGFE